MESEAPTRSGTHKNRRLAHASVRGFYEEAYTPAVAKTKFPRRAQNTVVMWLKRREVRPWVFDRYMCAVCFEGRQAQSRIRNGAACEKDHDLSAKYEAHQKIVKNQGFHAKEDERTLTAKQLLAIFDYTTFHDYTREKVDYLVLLCHI